MLISHATVKNKDHMYCAFYHFNVCVVPAHLSVALNLYIVLGVIDSIPAYAMWAL